MPAKKIAVTFDTNSYRTLVNGLSKDEAIEKINEIIELEEKKNIIAFGSVIVGMEMLANLVEGENGFNYPDCLNGTIVLSKHCNDKTKNEPRMIAPVALSLQVALLNEVHSTELKERVENLSGSIRDFRDDSDKAIEHHTNQNTFEDIKSYIDTKEQEFSTQIESLVEGTKEIAKNMHPRLGKKELRTKTLELIKSDGFLETMSKAIVHVIYNNVGEHLSDEEASKRSEFLRDNFPLGAGFFQWVCHEVVSKNLDLQSNASKKKRWNWLWDYNVSYSVSNSSLDNREVLLVTADGDIHEILAEYGFANKVMTLEEYIKFLKD